jgi:hypothetical protein
MKLTLGQAAQEAGKNKSTISRDIAKGKLSAERQQDGSYLIDVSELFRVYPKPSENKYKATVANATDEVQNAMQLQSLRLQLDAALQRIADKEKHLSDKDQQIADLQQDRDHWRSHAERSTLLLEDLRQKDEARRTEEEVTPKKKRWWW